MKRLLPIFLALAFALTAGTLRAAEVTATLDPSEIEVGEATQLTVTVNGSSSEAPNVPDVAGLEIAHVGQSTQMQWINGTISASSVHTYQITPQNAGRFTIPAIRAGNASSRPLTLVVTGGAANGARSQSPGSNSQPPSNGSASQGPDATSDDASRYGFIRIVPAKKEFFVGEIVPVEIDACVPNGLEAQVTDLPTLTSDGFTLNPLDHKLRQTQREIGGRNYSVLTWHSALTAVRAGDYPIKVEMPMTVVIRERAQRRQNTGNDLVDQFFNDPFFNNQLSARQKPVTIANEPESLTALALPKEDRPADFSGAVGHFRLADTASPLQVAAGDPITLKLVISGSGNFDRVSSNGLANGQGWKTYPPKSTFEPSDGASSTGTKTFEQIAIPEDGAIHAIPPLHFSYFDPETRRYETQTTSPIAVSITGAPSPGLAAATPMANTPRNGSASPTPAAPDLVPNQVDAGSAVATLRPVFLSPWFLGAQGLPICALAGGLIFLRRQRRFAADPRRVRAHAASRAIQAQLAAMDDAMRRGDATGFFDSARQAVQQRLGERWGMRPETITLAEVRAHMNGESDGIRPIFEMADRIHYSGGDFGAADYQHWKEVVLSQLNALEKPA